MSKSKKKSGPITDDQIQQAAELLRPELDALSPPDDMQKLEVLPGLFGQVVPDPRWDGLVINLEEWPAIFAAAPSVGDLIQSIDGKQSVEVSRRGHAFGPLGPFVILFVKAFKE